MIRNDYLNYESSFTISESMDWVLLKFAKSTLWNSFLTMFCQTAAASVLCRYWKRIGKNWSFSRQISFFSFGDLFICTEAKKCIFLPSQWCLFSCKALSYAATKKIRGDNSLIGWKYSFYFYFETKIYHKLHSLIMKKKEYLFHINIYFRTYFPFVCLTFLY